MATWNGRVARERSKFALSTRRYNQRERLFQAATDVFARCGYYGTTIEAVAAAADMSKHTVYSYFADKDDLFRALVIKLDLRPEPTDLDEIGAVLNEALQADQCSREIVLSEYLEKVSSSPRMRLARAELEAAWTKPDIFPEAPEAEGTCVANSDLDAISKLLRVYLLGTAVAAILAESVPQVSSLLATSNLSELLASAITKAVG